MIFFTGLMGLVLMGSGYPGAAQAATAVGLAAKPKIHRESPWNSWNSRTLYEINVRHYSAEGTLKAVTQDLTRIKSLGVGTLWLMPIQPLGILGRKGSLGSPYSIRDYTAVNPDMGSEEDLRALVNTAHSLDMKVILDWVANHTAWDNTWTLHHRDFFTLDREGRFISPVPDWSDVIDLDYSSKGLRVAMIEAMQYWLRKADVDGFRCDVASMVPTDFWFEARPKLEEVKPLFMLAESDAQDLSPGAFNATYNFQVHKALRQLAKGQMNGDQLWSTMISEYQRFPETAQLMNFTTNHDENSWGGTNEQLYGKATAAFMTFIFTIPGIPLIYNGEEAGLDKQLSFFDKDQIVWRDHPFQKLYSQLNKLRKQLPIMQSNWKQLQRVPIQGPRESVLAYQPAPQVLVIMNLSGKQQTFRLPVGGSFGDFLTDESLELKESEYLQFAPWQYQILVRR